MVEVQELEDDHGVHHLDFKVEVVIVPHPEDKDHLLAVVRHQDVDRLLRQGVVQEVQEDPQDGLPQEDLEVQDVGHLKGRLQGDHLQEDVGGSIPVLQVRPLHRVNFLCDIIILF